jgi:N-acetylneuraminic acid mutarotase
MKNIIKTALFIFFFSYSLIQGQPGNWEIVGKMPIKISGSESVVVDSTIYFFGGYSDSLQNVVDWIYSYKPIQNAWNFIGHMKKKRVNFIADKIGSKIYCVGGEVNNFQKSGGTIEEFDCNTFNSATIDSNIQFDRQHSTGLIKDSTLFIIGGMTHNPPNETTSYIIEYSIPSNKITYNYIPSFPGMRTEQMSSYLFKNLYIFGGLFNTVSSEIYSFGISDHQLILQHPGLLRPRTNGRAITLDDSSKVIILGGYNEINTALNSVELIEFVDTMHFTNHLIQPMNFKRNDCMAVYFDGSIYVFGGVDEFKNPIDKVERLKYITGINEAEYQVPTEYKVEQNYPNPFNLTTIIRYTITETSIISIKVYDIIGREVANLINEEKPPGNYNISFNGNGLASGVYYYRIEEARERGAVVRGYTETKKMILLK